MNKFVDIQWAYIDIRYKSGEKMQVTNYPNGLLDSTLFDSDGNVIRQEKITHEILNQHIAVNFPNISRIGIY